MEKDETYDLRNAKRLVKKLKKSAIKSEKSLDIQNALMFYTKAKKIANAWNLNKISAWLSVKISQILIQNLKNDLKTHLDAINRSEASREYINVYEHTKAALLIAYELKNHNLNERAFLINELEEKLKYLDNYFSTIIIARFNNGNLYKTPIILTKALEMIGIFPNSFEIADNFISFENGINQKIYFKQISRNSWYMEIPLLDKFLNGYKLKFKYISTNIVKVITLNFFRGYFIGDYACKSENSYQQRNKLFSIVRKINYLLTQFSECQFCNNQILNIGQKKCEYCGIEINYEDLLFPNFR